MSDSEDEIFFGQVCLKEVKKIFNVLPPSTEPLKVSSSESLPSEKKVSDQMESDDVILISDTSNCDDLGEDESMQNILSVKNNVSANSSYNLNNCNQSEVINISSSSESENCLEKSPTSNTFIDNEELSLNNFSMKMHVMSSENISMPNTSCTIDLTDDNDTGVENFSTNISNQYISSETQELSSNYIKNNSTKKESLYSESIRNINQSMSLEKQIHSLFNNKVDVTDSVNFNLSLNETNVNLGDSLYKESNVKTSNMSDELSSSQLTVHRKDFGDDTLQTMDVIEYKQSKLSPCVSKSDDFVTGSPKNIEIKSNENCELSHKPGSSNVIDECISQNTTFTLSTANSSNNNFNDKLSLSFDGNSAKLQKNNEPENLQVDDITFKNSVSGDLIVHNESAELSKVLNLVNADDYSSLSCVDSLNNKNDVNISISLENVNSLKLDESLPSDPVIDSNFELSRSKINSQKHFSGVNDSVKEQNDCNRGIHKSKSSPGTCSLYSLDSLNNEKSAKMSVSPFENKTNSFAIENIDDLLKSLDCDTDAETRFSSVDKDRNTNPESFKGVKKIIESQSIELSNENNKVMLSCNENNGCISIPQICFTEFDELNLNSEENIVLFENDCTKSKLKSKRTLRELGSILDMKYIDDSLTSENLTGIHSLNFSIDAISEEDVNSVKNLSSQVLTESPSLRNDLSTPDENVNKNELIQISNSIEKYNIDEKADSITKEANECENVSYVSEVYDDYSCSDNSNLNDTLENMEKLMKYGMKYMTFEKTKNEISRCDFTKTYCENLNSDMQKQMNIENSQNIQNISDVNNETCQEEVIKNLEKTVDQLHLDKNSDLYKCLSRQISDLSISGLNATKTDQIHSDELFCENLKCSSQSHNKCREDSNHKNEKQSAFYFDKMKSVESKIKNKKYFVTPIKKYPTKTDKVTPEIVKSEIFKVPSKLTPLSDKKKNVKVEQTDSKKKFFNTPKSAEKFKNIISPISLYINKTATSGLVQNIRPSSKPIHLSTPKETIPVVHNNSPICKSRCSNSPKENIPIVSHTQKSARKSADGSFNKSIEDKQFENDLSNKTKKYFESPVNEQYKPVIPKKAYKSASQIKTKTELSEINIPPSIKKYFPDTPQVVIKHERIKTPTLRQKLFNDITNDSALALDDSSASNCQLSSTDVSIRILKPALR